MAFTKTSDEQVQCTCGRYYNVGDFCHWCGKPVEQPADQPESTGEMPEGEQAPTPVDASPQEEPVEEPSEEEEEPVAAEAPPVEPPIATPPPVEGRRSRRER